MLFLQISHKSFLKRNNQPKHAVKENVSQRKVLQYNIMDAILNQIEKGKQDKRSNPWLTGDVLNNHEGSLVAHTQ
jgi:hypothetical protein